RTIDIEYCWAEGCGERASEIAAGEGSRRSLAAQRRGLKGYPSVRLIVLKPSSPTACGFAAVGQAATVATLAIIFFDGQTRVSWFFFGCFGRGSFLRVTGVLPAGAQPYSRARSASAAAFSPRSLSARFTASMIALARPTAA